MPSCILRVSGSTAKVRKFLAASSIEPSRVFWRGDPGFPKSRGPITRSGFNIELSAANGLEAQAAQAAAFIRKNKADFILLNGLGFARVTIDFGLYDESTEDRPWPCYRLPTSIVKLAGEIGGSIELSFYGFPPDAA